MKLDNRGVSLVELLVVVGIISILATTSFSAAGYLSRGDIKKATKLLASSITTCRTNTMAKTGNWDFTADHTTGVYVLTNNWDEETESVTEDILSSRVSSIMVTYDTTTVELEKIEFEKSTGAVKKIYGTGGTVVYDRNDSAFPLAGYADITVTVDSKNSTLRLNFLTGKIEQK